VLLKSWFKLSVGQHKRQIWTVLLKIFLTSGNSSTSGTGLIFSANWVFLALLGITYNTLCRKVTDHTLADAKFSVQQILCSSYGSLLSLLEGKLGVFFLLLYREASLVLYKYSMGQLDSHDEPSSMGSAGLRDPKPPLCTCVINGQWVLPCHDKMEMGLNWLASNAWEEWKNLIGFEEPMYSVLMLFLHNVITARLLAANRTGTTPFRLRASANQDLSSCWGTLQLFYKSPCSV
jgi:hypothetical protein